MGVVLVTNDDGYRSAGYVALIDELSKRYEVLAVAPVAGRSWAGKSVSTCKKLRVKKTRVHGNDVFLVNGTPADCVQIGLYHLLSDKPLFMVSGVNIGLNIGNARMLSSGTLGAAMESALLGLPGIAVSLMIPQSIRDKVNLYDDEACSIFHEAVRITDKIIRLIMSGQSGRDVKLLSVNIPYDATVDSEVMVTKPFKASYGQLFYKSKGFYVHRTPDLRFVDLEEDSDLKAIHDGKISLTPVDLSLVCDSDVVLLRGILKGKNKD